MQASTSRIWATFGRLSPRHPPCIVTSIAISLDHPPWHGPTLRRSSLRSCVFWWRTADMLRFDRHLVPLNLIANRVLRFMVLPRVIWKTNRRRVTGMLQPWGCIGGTAPVQRRNRSVFWIPLPCGRRMVWFAFSHANVDGLCYRIIAVLRFVRISPSP